MTGQLIVADVGKRPELMTVRPATFGGRAYLCGRRNADFAVAMRDKGPRVESLMLESDDGLVTWNVIDGLSEGLTYPIYRLVDAARLTIRQ